MTWEQTVIEPMQVLMNHWAAFVPRAIAATVTLIVGWVLALAVRFLLARGLRFLRVDRLSERTKLNDALRRGGLRVPLVELLAVLAYWIVLAASLMAVLQVLGMSVAALWLERFGYFVPRLIASVVILLLGTLVAGFIGTTVRVASLNAGFPYGEAVSHAVSTAILVVAVIVSLEQLQVVTRTIEIALYILLGSFGLALALALGLGSQEWVRQTLSDWRASRRSERSDKP
jgi:hypothetical protein